MPYRLTFTPDSNGALLVTSPDLQEVTSWGETRVDALENGRRAVEEAIAARHARGDDLPPVPTSQHAA